MKPGESIRLILVLAAVCLLSSSCQSETGDTTANSIDLTAVIDRASPYQKAFLLDQVVTFSEYERSITMAAECLRTFGARVSGPHPRDGDRRFLSYEYQVVAPSEAQLAAKQVKVDAAAASCAEKYENEVALVWEYQNLLSPEERVSLLPEVAACVRDVAKLDVPEDVSSDQLLRIMMDADAEVVEPCVERYPDFFVTAGNG